MKEPLLKLVRCHRGKAAETLRLETNYDNPARFVRIPKGPLKGCCKGVLGGRLNVFKFGRGFVLEFRPVIRPGWPP